MGNAFIWEEVFDGSWVMVAMFKTYGDHVVAAVNALGEANKESLYAVTKIACPPKF